MIPLKEQFSSQEGQTDWQDMLTYVKVGAYGGCHLPRFNEAQKLCTDHDYDQDKILDALDVALDEEVAALTVDNGPQLR